jgi:diguanylate cyclase (GGDEF)-like protein
VDVDKMAVERIVERAPRPDGPLIETNRDDCRECWGCVRYCPSHAIRVVEHRSEIIEDRCVKCGACVLECGNCGHSVRDDTPDVRALLASERPVVAVLATEFLAALHPLKPGEVERALESAGFYAVESTFLGEEMVAEAYERSYARGCASLSLRSTCPVATDWVRTFYPSLVSALAPIVPPYVAQARLVKELYPSDAAVVYISPCYARKDEAFETDIAGAIDAVIDFTELEKLLSTTKPRPPYAEKVHPGGRRPEPVKQLSLIDGFPRSTLEGSSLLDVDIVSVRGLDEIDELLSAITRGESAPALVDMLNCEGCIDGPAVKPGMSVFAKRNIISAERDRSPTSSVSSRELLSYLPTPDLLRSFRPTPAAPLQASPEEIDESLAEGEFGSRDDVLDCGACGYQTCVEHAVAVLHGNSSWEMCFPLQRERMKRRTEELEESATTDPLTGLGNRRVFDDRLEAESARVRRYGTPLALLMIDIDGFKEVNDGHGHTAGDAVLKGIAALIVSSVRETDIATRYGGDEYALLLPGIGKTEAFAVAEKLRSSVAEMTFEAPSESISVTVSIGVAAANGTPLDARGLLEAADSALYHAKQDGRDRVQLSPG